MAADHAAAGRMADDHADAGRMADEHDDAILVPEEYVAAVLPSAPSKNRMGRRLSGDDASVIPILLTPTLRRPPPRLLQAGSQPSARVLGVDGPFEPAHSERLSPATTIIHNESEVSGEAITVRPEMYTRRAILAATTTTLATAGCLSGGDATTNPTKDTNVPAVTTTNVQPTTADPTDQPEPTATETTVPIDEEAAASSLENARTALQATFDELARDETDHEALRGHLSDATAALDHAEVRATPAQRSRVTTLQDVTNYLTTVTNADAALAAGIGDLQTGVEAYWRARDHYFSGDRTTDAYEAAARAFDDAARTFDDTATRFDEARTDIEAGREDLQTLDRTVVSSFENVTYENQHRKLEGAIHIAANLTVFALAHANGAIGWTQTSNGLAVATTEQWASAKTTFENAKQPFQTASTHYDDTDTDRLYDSLPFLEDWFAPIVCEVELGVDMLEHFVASMDAALADDQDTHEAQANAGFEIHSECHD